MFRLDLLHAVWSRAISEWQLHASHAGAVVSIVGVGGQFLGVIHVTAVAAIYIVKENARGEELVCAKGT